MILCAPLVPLIDALLHGSHYRWDKPGAQPERILSKEFIHEVTNDYPGHAALVTVLVTTSAQAFCGFYVARADTSLFNRASQVVLVRDEDKTVITMANDFEGDAEDFAVVIPVPTMIEREQINVGDRAVIEHLDAYTSPRLVEYHDRNPCVVYERLEMSSNDAAFPSASKQLKRSARSRGVTIEAQYTVGEYDILILSATQSDGLIQWLVENDYRIPSGAERVVDSYLKQDMQFFVAKVNLEEQSKLGFQYLRPLQVAYESNRFMLPIRLGTLNAKGKQELYVYALTRTGRVETTNYRTVKITSNVTVPEFVEDEFANFYRAMFDRQTKAENERAVFLEYAWDMGWCDPCAADPLRPKELGQLGVFWLGRHGVESKRAMQPRRRTSSLRACMFATMPNTFPRTSCSRKPAIGRITRGAMSFSTHGRAKPAAISQLQGRCAGAPGTRSTATGQPDRLGSRDIRKKIPFAGGHPEPDEEPWWKRLWN